MPYLANESQIFRDIILDVFQAVSVMLVFVTVLFGIKYPKLLEAIEKEPPVGDKALERFKEELRRVLFLDCGALIVMTLLVLYTLLPLAIEVFRRKEIEFWSLNVLPMAYVVVTLGVLGFAVHEVVLAYRLIQKIRKL